MLIDMESFCADMLKLWLKLHEATRKALVRLPRHALTHTSFGSIRASQGRLQDCYCHVSENMSKSDNMREPLLQSPQQASIAGADGDR